MSTAAPLIRRLFALHGVRTSWPAVKRSAVAGALPRAGGITLITGPSGGGKSRLLRTLRGRVERARGTWIDPSKIVLADRCVVDCVCDVLWDESRGQESELLAYEARTRIVERALELLSRVGLAEAWTYLSRPAQLSDGQRWRLILALAFAQASGGSTATAIIAMDEFAALLDRVTAVVVARALRRLIDRSTSPRISAIVVTSHDDLIGPLDPETVVTCDFGKVEITPRRLRMTNDE